MANFVPDNIDLRVSLRFCFVLKNSVAEAHQMHVETYGDHALAELTCREWLRCFKSDDFDVRNEERGKL